MILLSMSVDGVQQVIGTLGFPIVMCGALFWKMHEQDKRHSEDIKSLGEIITNNTTAITSLLEHLKKGD